MLTVSMGLTKAAGLLQPSGVDSAHVLVQGSLHTLARRVYWLSSVSRKHLPCCVSVYTL